MNIYKQIKICSDECDGDVYFIYDDIRNRTKIAFIYNEQTKQWIYLDYKNISNQKHENQISLLAKGVQRCKSIGWSFVNTEYFCDLKYKLSFIRIGNINGGGFCSI